MNKEERQLLIAKFWCDIFKIACVEPGINPVDAANDAVKKFSERFPEEEKHYCAYHRTWGDHDTNNCPMLMQKPNSPVAGGLGGLGDAF